MKGEYIEPIFLEDLGMFYPKDTSVKKRRYGLYKCGYCGKEFEALCNSIKMKNTRSCGCQAGTITHHLSKHKHYNTWKDMIRRCYHTTYKGYHYYGGRGISVCEEWKDVRIFIEWAESTYIEGYTLDRVDNDGNYEPYNCTWSTASAQRINRRLMKNNTSGYVGVSKKGNKWEAGVRFNNVRTTIGCFNSIMEAVKARDEYIINNKLPHKLNLDSDFCEELEDLINLI